jgi:hypothetical protein
MRLFGLGASFSLDIGPGEPPVGLPRREVERITRSADFLLNIMGYVNDPHVLGCAKRLAFLDIDPGFPQMWDALGYCDMFAGHDVFLTVGRNVGREGCAVPSRGLPWVAVSPPVVVDLWPDSGEQRRAYTSVASWRGPYDPVVFEGKRYGLRAHEFRKFADLPRATGLPFEVALAIDAEDGTDAARLEGGGWRMVNPGYVADGPLRYWRYVRSSHAEFLVAKGMYVQSRSGWVSDRTACYLAAGRPALVQDTGLDGDLAAGWGLVTFRTLEEAVDGAWRIESDWKKHSRAARDLAREHFEADRVVDDVVAAVSGGH